MRLDILGCDGTYPGPGTATAGFLIHTDTSALWMEAGIGTLARLTERIDLPDLTAIAVSHRHIDHCADLAAFHHAARFGAQPIDRCPLYAAEGVLERLTAFNPGTEESFHHHRVEPGDDTPVGDLRIAFGPTNHSAEAVSMRIEDAEGSVAYTGDTGWDDRLVEFAAGVDLLVSEATLVGEASGRDGHQSPADAGRLARLAGAGRLLLVHIPPHLDRDRAVEEARAEFEGPISAGRERMIIDVGAT